MKRVLLNYAVLGFSSGTLSILVACLGFELFTDLSRAFLLPVFFGYVLACTASGAVAGALLESKVPEIPAGIITGLMLFVLLNASMHILQPGPMYAAVCYLAATIFAGWYLIAPCLADWEQTKAYLRN